MIVWLPGGTAAWRCAWAASVALLVAAPAYGQTLNDRLLIDVGDGQLDDTDFIAAALIAGGVEDECELGGWLDCYAQRRADGLRTSEDLKRGNRLQALHLALHGTLLYGDYEISASDLRRALSGGNYNCLSALAIYYDWCKAAGLEIEIRLRRGHVYLQAVNGGAGLAVEPGARSWSPGMAGWESSSRRISPVQLLGKFYYNRGVEALKGGDFAYGLELLKISLRFDPDDDDARANLVAGLNNWAVAHCQAQRFDRAAPLIEQGLSIDPLFAPLIANQRLVRARLAD